MSRNLQLKVIVKVIETRDQPVLMRSMDGDMGQGWYFSEALRSGEFLAMCWYLASNCSVYSYTQQQIISARHY